MGKVPTFKYFHHPPIIPSPHLSNFREFSKPSPYLFQPPQIIQYSRVAMISRISHIYFTCMQLLCDKEPLCKDSTCRGRNEGRSHRVGVPQPPKDFVCRQSCSTQFVLVREVFPSTLFGTQVFMHCRHFYNICDLFFVFFVSQCEWFSFVGKLGFAPSKFPLSTPMGENLKNLYY